MLQTPDPVVHSDVAKALVSQGKGETAVKQFQAFITRYLRGSADEAVSPQYADRFCRRFETMMNFVKALTEAKADPHRLSPKAKSRSKGTANGGGKDQTKNENENKAVKQDAGNEKAKTGLNRVGGVGRLVSRMQVNHFSFLR